MRLWVTGYRSYEIGTFGNDDPKITVIQYALEQRLREHLENGLEWVITGGQMGVEQWTVDVVATLKPEFPDLKVAMMLPFKEFGSQWSENNQAEYRRRVALTDFAESVSQQPYQNPKQLQNYQKFMLEHTDAALMVYDAEFVGKAQYDWVAAQNFSAAQPYPINQIDMDNLQDYATEYEESQQNTFFDA
ncbi:MAG TPA: DUF1273 domain-containing protein [Lactobacillaceae bacterium]|jgi:uncharacterized phage-like protein YoqJ